MTGTCSTFSKARKTLAYVLRFVNNTRMKTKNRDPISPKLTESELWLFKWCQQTIDVDKLDKKLIPYGNMEIKYRSVKIQQETVTDRLIETGSKEDLLMATQQVRDKVRGDFLKYSDIFATYQKACNFQEPLLKHDVLKAMTRAATKIADVLGLQKTASHGLEKLSVPTWDGNRKSYTPWKSQFNCWMYKYKQDEDKQL